MRVDAVYLIGEVGSKNQVAIFGCQCRQEKEKRPSLS
jgi:hypothetical protein